MSTLSKPILFFIDPMGYGSLAVYDYSILSNIRDFNTHYFCNGKNKLHIVNSHMHEVYRYSDKKGVFKLHSYLVSQCKIAYLSWKKRPSLIHFQWLKTPALDYILLCFLKRLKLPIVLTAHNLLPHNTGNKHASSYKKIYKKVDNIIVHAKITKKELIERFGIVSEKITVIPHGIFDINQNPNFDSKNLEQEFIKNHNLQEKTIFTVLGGINHYKGVDIVIDAWKSIDYQSKSKIHLMVAGKGNVNNLNLLKMESNVTLINRFLKDEEFLAILRISDYVLLPYRQISQSGVLLTALKEKKKVIVSNKGGLSEPFQFGPIGYVLNNLKTSTLAEAIVNAHKNKNNTIENGVWEKIHSFYDWKEITKKTERLYHIIKN